MTKRLLGVGMLCLTAALTFGVPAAPATQAAQAPAGAVSAAAGDPAELRVASFNIQSVSLDKTSGNQRPWRQRRAGVIADIMGERPDVIGLQEANPSRSFASRLKDGPTQYYDLRNGLNKAGGNYQVTNGYAFNCVRSTTSYKCRYKYRGASHGDRILYNRSTLTLLSQGANKFAVQGAGPDPRYIAWAVFRVRSTGRSFLFVNTHLRGGSTVRTQWTQLIRRVNQLKRSRPVVVVGDFNTQKFAQPSDQMLPAMRRAGYGDVLNQQYRVNPVGNPRAQHTVNGWVNSLNHLNRNMRDWSYDERRGNTGNNIDWIFATNSLPVLEYKTVVHYDSSLRVVGTFRSDHNMIRATLLLR
jgi:endonuclease/exonuclease/phosphatase family metal-dependent hydrolase